MVITWTTSPVTSQSCHENLSPRSENKFQKATLCAIWLATKLSFPKRFHCDLEGLFFFQVLNCAVQHVFWAEKHAQLWSLCNFCLSLGKKRNLRSGFLWWGNENVWYLEALASKFVGGSWRVPCAILLKHLGSKAQKRLKQQKSLDLEKFG